MRPEITWICDEEILTTTTNQKSRISLYSAREPCLSMRNTDISDDMESVENSTRVLVVEMSDFIRFRPISIKIENY